MITYQEQIKYVGILTGTNQRCCCNRTPERRDVQGETVERLEMQHWHKEQKPEAAATR
jgi:hypothetical protein